MTQEELVEETLEKFFPDECELAGPTNVRAIARNSVEFVPTKYGSNLNLSLILTMLAAAVGTVNSLVSIYNGLSKRAKSGPSPDEEKKFLESRPPEISAELFEAICEHVRKRLQQELLLVPAKVASSSKTTDAELEIEPD